MVLSMPAEAMPAPPQSDPSMPVEEAFVAVALAAVSWDGTLTAAGTRALRHAIDYRAPYRQMGEAQVALLITRLLEALRQRGAQHLMLDAARSLDADRRRSAYAVAAEIMRSDGPLLADERNILSTLAATLELDGADTSSVLEVMEVLHAPVV
ncbi:tellurite resistance TerB family protein [Cyanobium sp. CH-040]|uniref:tellurite resistance TerB family protein n=1 Tax=Cyanobium sp. CH-040 TaxID=2823708 RepID=UPI0020CB8158|nr:tellurite resistance TerB family protein [Cyanobium sp. CH-040]